MGLCATAKGLTAETEFNCGYITYGNFIIELVRVAYGQRLAESFRSVALLGHGMPKPDIDLWNRVCSPALDLLIFHSDCYGKFSWQECRDIYKAMLPLNSKMTGHNYEVMKTYNMFDHWKNIFHHCWKRRVNLYYR